MSNDSRNEVVITPAKESKGNQADVALIASNVDRSLRVAPLIDQTSVIDDMYDFAAQLRTGSNPR